MLYCRLWVTNVHRAFTSKLASSSWRLSVSSDLRRDFSGGSSSPSVIGAPFTATENLRGKNQKKCYSMNGSSFRTWTSFFSYLQNGIILLVMTVMLWCFTCGIVIYSDHNVTVYQILVIKLTFFYLQNSMVC